MRYFFLSLLNFVVLCVSVAGLLSTCMWGCPNTEIQLQFKLATLLLFISQMGIAVLWLMRKAENKEVKT